MRFLGRASLSVAAGPHLRGPEWQEEGGHSGQQPTLFDQPALFITIANKVFFVKRISYKRFNLKLENEKPATPLRTNDVSHARAANPRLQEKRS